MSIRKLLAAIFIVGVLFFRPGFLGQSYSIVGAILIAAVVPMYLITTGKYRSTSSLWMARLALVQVFFWMYCIAFAIGNGESNNEFALKATALGVTTAIAYYLVLSDRNMNALVYKTFALANTALGYSIFISAILVFVVDYDRLILLSMDIKGYEDAGSGFNGDVLFPFSPVYGYISEYGIYRFMGAYREAGIAQLFFVWSATYLYFLKERKSLILGSVLGALLSGSTSAFISIGLVVMGYLVFEKRLSAKKLLILVPAFVFFLSLVIYLPGMGLLDKSETHFDSLDDRWRAVEYIFDDIQTFIFGKGLYYLDTPFVNIGINAISFSYFIGLIGLVFYFSTFFIYGAYNTRRNAVRYYLLVTPLLVTSLFFQPLIDAPLACFLLYCIPPSDSV